MAQYFQIIPLYLKSDKDAFDYFRVFKEEIDQITGSALVLVSPEQIEGGEAKGLAPIFKTGSKLASQFSGLKWQDLPCLWLQDGDGGRCILRIRNELGSSRDLIRALTDECALASNAEDLAKRVNQALDRAIVERTAIGRLLKEIRAMAQDTDRRIAIFAGIAFLAALFVLAIFIKNPTPFQYVIFKSILAIAGAAFAVAIPGILDITIGNWLKASGALAVLVLLYYFSPAALVASP